MMDAQELSWTERLFLWWLTRECYVKAMLCVVGVIGMVFLVAGLGAVMNEMERGYARRLVQAESVAQTYLERLGTPALGGIACRWRGSDILCDAATVGAVVTLVCTDACHPATHLYAW